ncbi:MAG: hypothetical protein J6W69_08520, partial [Bacteroidales bacterium]|nr:hypothetical protein [Bacteroidales bacterium]
EVAGISNVKRINVSPLKHIFTRTARQTTNVDDLLTISNDAMSYWNKGWWQHRKNDHGVAQAVALHVEADRTVFRNCRLLGFQDTVFNGNDDSRQVFYNC